MRRNVIIPVVVLLCLLGFVIPSMAISQMEIGYQQEIGQSSTVLQPINADNADDMTLLHRLGNGKADQILYSPAGNLLAVAGTLGVWLYDSSDLTQTPRLLAQ